MTPLFAGSIPAISATSGAGGVPGDPLLMEARKDGQTCATSGALGMKKAGGGAI